MTNKLLRKVLGPNKKDVEGAGENSIIGSFIISDLHQMILGLSDQGGRVGRSVGTGEGAQKFIQGFIEHCWALTMVCHSLTDPFICRLCSSFEFK